MNRHTEQTNTKKSVKKIGFIGFGNFGKMLGNGLSDNYDISFYDPATEENSWSTKISSLNTLVDENEVIVISVPYEQFDAVVNELLLLDATGKLIVDVLSTKEKATNKLQRVLPSNDLLSLHPLFGPPSYTKIEPNLVTIATLIKGPSAEKFIQSLKQDYKMKIVERTASEHDEEMAMRHGFPFFISRSLLELGFNNTTDDMSIPSERKLHAIVDIATDETDALYKTIMHSNPYTHAAVDKLISKMIEERDKLWPKG